MKNVVNKFAISLGDHWFTGFTFDPGGQVPGKAKTSVLLIDEDQLRLSVQDLRRVGAEFEVFHASFVKVNTKELKI